jgi:hypothetical protein
VGFATQHNTARGGTVGFSGQLSFLFNLGEDLTKGVGTRYEMWDFMDRKHILCKITFPAFQSLEGEEWGLEGASAVVPRGVDRGQLRPCAGPSMMPIPLDGTEISPHQPHPFIHTCEWETRGRV